MAAGRGVTGKGWARAYIIYLSDDELWRHLGAGGALGGVTNLGSGDVRRATVLGWKVWPAVFIAGPGAHRCGTPPGQAEHRDGLIAVTMKHCATNQCGLLLRRHAWN